MVFNVTPPSEAVLWRYAREHKHPLQLGQLPEGCEVIEGGFWGGSIARHDRARLRAAVWAALATRLLKDASRLGLLLGALRRPVRFAHLIELRHALHRQEVRRHFARVGHHDLGAFCVHLERELDLARP